MKKLHLTFLLFFSALMVGYAQDSKKFSETGFTKLSMGSAFNITVTQGKTYNITVQGRSEDINDLKASVKNGVFYLGYQTNGFSRFHRSVSVDITMPTLESVEFSGATKVNVSKFEHVKKMDVAISGASQVVMNFTTSKVNMELSGASSLTLIGSCDILNGEVSGASSFKGKGFSCKEVNIDASGASKALVLASNSVHAKASGASSVRYSGSASDIHSSTSGASSVKHD